MKTKKALAVLLAVVMLVMPLAVSSFAANSIITGPIKTAYNDSEYFNPQGVSIFYDGEIIVYAPTDSDFRFEPALNELLTVETVEVKIYYNNEFIGTVPVSVDHLLGELTAVDNGHGYFCLGCGTLHNFETHVVDEWIPNDDGGIFTMQTQTGVCTVCEAEVTEYIPGSAKFDSLFNSDLMTSLEGTILGYVSSILVTLVQALVGIK